MQTKITWFRHHHENRNDLLRFGFMRLHYRGELNYTERPFGDIGKAGFSHRIAQQNDPRHLSFILVEKGSSKVRCLVDNEDSFALITPLIADVDVCFCAGYNSDFFVRKQFVRPYAWQNETMLQWYRQTLEEKVERLGDHFGKIQKFIPIAPNQGYPVPISQLKQKYKNLLHRLNRLSDKGSNFRDVYTGFEIREAQLDEFRKEALAYDIVLNDSLWGWPQHRINLHHRLQELYSKGRNIYSRLNYTPPVEHDGSLLMPPDAAPFPLLTGKMELSYEVMLSKSRLAVFACGFHWGWRNILMFALRTGIPVLTDRLLTEAYFDMNEFHLLQQESHDWSTIEPELSKINSVNWTAIKLHNQAVYDQYMRPETVAQYFINSLD